MKNSTPSVADTIRQARKRKGLTQTTLQELLGGYSVSMIELGRRLPSPPMSKKLVEVLGLPEDFHDLVEEERRRVLPTYQRREAKESGLRRTGRLEKNGAVIVQDDFALDESRIFPVPTIALEVGSNFWEPEFRRGDMVLAVEDRTIFPGDTILIETTEGTWSLGHAAFKGDSLVVANGNDKTSFQRDDLKTIAKVVARLLKR